MLTGKARRYYIHAMRLQAKGQGHRGRALHYIELAQARAGPRGASSCKWWRQDFLKKHPLKEFIILIDRMRSSAEYPEPSRPASGQHRR